MRPTDRILENSFGYRDLYPVFFGYEDCKAGKSFGPAVRDLYLVHYVTEGRGVLKKGGVDYPVQAGEIFLIFPNEVTLYTADADEPWHYIWIGFDGTLAEKLRELPSPVMPLHGGSFRELRTLGEAQASASLFVTACLHRMFAILFEDTGGRLDYVARAENEVEARYMHDISVASIAASLSLDRRYLSRLFRDKRGITLGQYIINVRIDKAKRLLAAGFSVSRTAEMVGYPDYTGFSKLFRKHVGVPPSAYLEDFFNKNT